MALKPNSVSKHNAMFGRKAPRPQSPSVLDDDFPLPPAKRLKTDNGTRHDNEGPSDNEHGGQKIPLKAEAPECSYNSDDDAGVPPSSAPTELESTLPPIRTDKEAIREYEATRAAEAAGLDEAGDDNDDGDLKKRLDKRAWIRGKSSIYVDAFNLALDTVLADESHLFSAPEKAVFQAWGKLSYDAQYLYVRLFLRKNAAWHRIQRLGYHSDIADMQAAVNDLVESRGLPEANEGDEEYFQAEPHLMPVCLLEQSFAFADASGEHIKTLDEASSLLQLDELKSLAKEARAQGKNKKELLQALRLQSSTQGGLGRRTIKRSETEESTYSEVSTTNEDWDSGDLRSSRDDHFVQKILASTGECIRLSDTTRKLFERVHLVFYRSSEWTEKSLTAIILARISRRNYPEYIVCRTTNIFPSRSLLLEFEAAVRTQFAIDNILEFNGPVRKEGYDRILKIFEEVYPRWQRLLGEELEKEIRVYETGEGAYLRRFSPAWVYTRIVHKALLALARFKEHKREHSILTELLDQQLFHPSRRGDWYQRKALIEEHYMWALEPCDGRTEDLQKRHWKKIALQTCQIGLQDRDCHVKYHYDLQKRIAKLERSLKIPKREQHDFEHVKFAKLVERNVEGIKVERERSATPADRRGSEAGTPMRGVKTVWIDEREGGGECSVEAMCLSWYRDQGWKGYHCEGGIIRTLFGYLFFDILFTFVPNVFQTEYQTCPLDLHSDAFYPSRISLINQRLAAISNGEARDIFQDVYEKEEAKQTCIVGVRWDYGYDDLVDILDCFPGSALATVCQVMAQEYQNRGGGVPDLFLWNTDTKTIMFSEVKSENDRLSDTQRLWMHVLAGAGVRVELCHAVAKEVRRT